MVLIRWDVFFLLWAGMMVFHLVTYFGSQYLEGEPHTVGGALDERIPFHPGWIYIYSSWFVLLLGVPALLIVSYIQNTEDRGAGSLIFTIAVSAIAILIGFVVLCCCWGRCGNVIEGVFLPFIMLSMIGVVCLGLLLALLACSGIFGRHVDGTRWDYYD